MARSKRIGLREVRALQPNEIAWDTAVSGFGARRQRDATFSNIAQPGLGSAGIQ